jgi:hypothetical protein
METRGESREKAEIEQGNNKETRRICSLLISRRIGRIGNLKESTFINTKKRQRKMLVMF